jgi:hypothetical protein
MNIFCPRGSVHVRFVATLAALVAAHAANAQSSVTWATDASVGFSHGGGGEFVNRSYPLAEMGASVRRALRHGVGLDAEVDYDWSGNINQGDILCAVDSRGNCVPDFPYISGPTGLVGVTFGAADVVQVRVNAGMAAYSADNTRLGAPVTAIDVAAAPMSWLAVVAGGRAFALPNYRGDRLTVTTWHLGVRLQTHR